MNLDAFETAVVNSEGKRLINQIIMSEQENILEIINAQNYFTSVLLFKYNILILIFVIMTKF
jgi:hypothetical protein